MTALIPDMTCKAGCHDCCGAPPFSHREQRKVCFASQARDIRWQNIGNGAAVPIGKNGLDCPFLGSEGCTIYENRPTICRLFGHVDHPRMMCPHGCGSKTFSDKQSCAAINAEMRVA